MTAQEWPADVVALIAQSLDHPSVFMGGPSQRNKRRAEYLLSLLPASAQAVIRGDAVAVPRNEVESVRDKLWREGMPTTLRIVEGWLAAKPFAQEPTP